MTPQPADLDRLERKHTRTTKPTMEPDPADPMRARQTAYCQWCAVHQMEDDPRWPCLTSRLVAAAKMGAAGLDVDRLARALEAPWPASFSPQGYGDPRWKRALAEVIAREYDGSELR